MAHSAGVCFVGLMVGRHPGQLTSQGLLVADRLARHGRFAISVTSAVRNRYLRLADILTTLIRKRNAVDVQCLEIYGGPSFVVEDLASALGRALGQRIVMVLHGGAMPTFMAQHPRWTRRVLARADALVTPSPYLQRALDSIGFAAQVIPNTLDLDDYPFRHRQRLQPRLFWMRSFHSVWNPEMAVRVLQRVRARVPEATLVMAGQDKGTQAAVQQLASELGVDGAVRFPGFLDTRGKATEASSADIYLNTNRIDNMPVAVLEAAAFGLPVVATRVGGIPDLLSHERTALFVQDDDDQAMADAVLRLLADQELASRLSAQGRQLAERFAWDEIRPQWEQLFAGLLHLKPVATPELAR